MDEGSWARAREAAGADEGCARELGRGGRGTKEGGDGGVAGNEYVGFKVSLPIGNEIGEVNTQDLLRVAAATADGETVSAIVEADDEAFLVFTVVVHCYFFSWAKPEGKGGGGGFLVMGVGGTVGIDNLVEVGKIEFDGDAIVETDDVGVVRG